MKYLNSILEQIGSITNVQKKFMITLFTTILTLRGKMTFTNMSRYSEFSEKTYRRHFSEKIDFEQLNKGTIERAIPATATQMAVMDASFIDKSGKKTYGIDYFFNGCASRAEKGMEISAISVVDVDANIGYTLSVKQTPAQVKAQKPANDETTEKVVGSKQVADKSITSAIKAKKKKSSKPGSSKKLTEQDNTRIDFYLEHLKKTRSYLPTSIRYITADGAYAKIKYANGVRQLDLHLISKLRCDANLLHLYTGPHHKRRGARRKYDGKVNLQDVSQLTYVCEVEDKISLYTAVVRSVCLKLNIRIAYLLDRRDDKKTRFVVLFSTDIEIDPKEIYRFYKSRFQIEFIFRDAKQFTGLTDCQARDKDKLDFHFNASLSALNLAKLDAHLDHTSDEPFVFSMDNSKRHYFNDYLLNQFISMLDLDQTLIKNHPNYEFLRACGSIAA